MLRSFNTIALTFPIIFTVVFALTIVGHSTGGASPNNNTNFLTKYDSNNRNNENSNCNNTDVISVHRCNNVSNVNIGTSTIIIIKTNDTSSIKNYSNSSRNTVVKNVISDNQSAIWVSSGSNRARQVNNVNRSIPSSIVKNFYDNINRRNVTNVNRSKSNNEVLNITVSKSNNDGNNIGTLNGTGYAETIDLVRHRRTGLNQDSRPPTRDHRRFPESVAEHSQLSTTRPAAISRAQKPKTTSTSQANTTRTLSSRSFRTTPRVAIAATPASTIVNTTVNGTKSESSESRETPTTASIAELLAVNETLSYSTFPSLKLTVNIDKLTPAATKIPSETSHTLNKENGDISAEHNSKTYEQLPTVFYNSQFQVFKSTTEFTSQRPLGTNIPNLHDFVTESGSISKKFKRKKQTRNTINDCPTCFRSANSLRKNNAETSSTPTAGEEEIKNDLSILSEYRLSANNFDGDTSYLAEKSAQEDTSFFKNNERSRDNDNVPIIRSQSEDRETGSGSMRYPPEADNTSSLHHRSRHIYENRVNNDGRNRTFNRVPTGNLRPVLRRNVTRPLPPKFNNNRTPIFNQKNNGNPLPVAIQHSTNDNKDHIPESIITTVQNTVTTTEFSNAYLNNNFPVKDITKEENVTVIADSETTFPSPRPLDEYTEDPLKWAIIRDSGLDDDATGDTSHDSPGSETPEVNDWPASNNGSQDIDPNTSDHNVDEHGPSDSSDATEYSDGMINTPVGRINSKSAGLMLYLLLVICAVLLAGLVILAVYWAKAKCEVRRLDTEMRTACLHGLDHRFADVDL